MFKDYYSTIIGLLEKNEFNVKPLNKLPTYSTVLVFFEKYSFYLFIWHEKIKNKQDCLDLYKAIQDYKHPDNPTHNSRINFFKEDHVIVCKSLDGKRSSKIEEYADKEFKFHYCKKDEIIKHIIEYFSYQYVISKEMNVEVTNSFAKFMRNNIKKITLFDDYCKKFAIKM
ncbi:15400_t:CDS:1 [Gigaspora margarita]|uniref:15400_t:CDS:1 n=1 Tax=Gigaspora margarita TaxID=4874 RepID=A0ABN7UBY4_GIGMA|nr:15400_t:CDS:1 [Gigaspora margarita]